VKASESQNATALAERPQEESPSIRVPARIMRLLALAAIYLTFAYALPRPEAVTPAGWRSTGVFLSIIAGFMLRPLAPAALIVIGVPLFALAGGLPLTRVLSGFASSSVWLVVAAMLFSRVLTDTGLARRIALFFVRHFGRSSLGVSYSLVLSDVVLAAGIPSITARSGGIILPIARSVAQLFGSRPGGTESLLGSFLLTVAYQSSAVACAMFLTGQASNVLAAGLARQATGINITWSSWFLAALVPGAVSCLMIPYLVYRMLPPLIRRTPEAVDFACHELSEMGPMSRAEKITSVVFVGVCLLWITSAWHGLEVTVVAFVGLAVLLITNVLAWETAVRERSVWDMFVWYGGLITMGEILNETGSTKAFAATVGDWLGGMGWLIALIVTLLIYFYSHYAFASITTHVLAMFPAFTTMLVALGAPAPLAVYSLACLANLTAGLTHYGTTTGPIVFAENYVALGDWWRVGLAASIVNLAIWLTVGFGWWKLVGIW